MPRLIKAKGGRMVLANDAFTHVEDDQDLPADRVAEAVEQMVEVYLRERRDGERFLDTFRRTGVAPFKEAVYADAH